MSPYSTRMIAIHLVFALFLCGVQTSVWPSLLGSVPAPQFWLCWILYISLYRGYFEALFMSYFFGLLMTSMTSLHLKVIWLSFLVLISTASFARNKVFWPGLRYFMIATFLMCLGWNFCAVGFSALFESKSIIPEFLPRLFEIALTTMASPVVYMVMTWLERFRPDDTASPAGASL